MKTVIEMAREAGMNLTPAQFSGVLEDEIDEFQLERFAELVRADEREKYKWDVHSCGPTCTKVACVAMREAVEAEREACAKVCEELPFVGEFRQWERATLKDCATAIRARSNT